MVRYCFFLITFLVYASFSGVTQEIQIQYLGHSAFILNFDSIHVVADYGKPNAWKQWGWDSEIHSIGSLIPDIITYSHLHEDHYDSTRMLKGVKHILKNGSNLIYEGLKINSIETCEDQFGDFYNTSYLFSYRGINILHTGDIQGMIAQIEEESIKEYFQKKYPKKIDVLIMPIEGKIKYIQQAEKFIRFINPGIVIPTHYWSEEYLNEFISYVKRSFIISRINDSIFKLEEAQENKEIEIVILKRNNFKTVSK